MAKPSKRKVYVEKVSDSWAVVYSERKYRGHRWAACFYAKDHTEEQVKEWVRKNPKLELATS